MVSLYAIEAFLLCERRENVSAHNSVASLKKKKINFNQCFSVNVCFFSLARSGKWVRNLLAEILLLSRNTDIFSCPVGTATGTVFQSFLD